MAATKKRKTAKRTTRKVTKRKTSHRKAKAHKRTGATVRVKGYTRKAPKRRRCRAVQDFVRCG